MSKNARIDQKDHFFSAVNNKGLQKTDSQLDQVVGTNLCSEKINLNFMW